MNYISPVQCPSLLQAMLCPSRNDSKIVVAKKLKYFREMLYQTILHGFSTLTCPSRKLENLEEKHVDVFF
jgi:hypothetical protein